MLERIKWLVGVLSGGVAAVVAMVSSTQSAAAYQTEPAVEIATANHAVVDSLAYSSPYWTSSPDLTYIANLSISLDTSQLFNGAQLMIDALSSPYLLIAGLGLGVAILAAIMKAVTTLRL